MRWRVEVRLTAQAVSLFEDVAAGRCLVFCGAPGVLADGWAVIYSDRVSRSRLCLSPHRRDLRNEAEGLYFIDSKEPIQVGGPVRDTAFGLVTYGRLITKKIL